MPQRINSVKIAGQKCTVVFTELVGKVHRETTAVESQGLYHPDLYQALQALLGPTVGLAGLPKEWLDDEHELRCNGVSIQRDETGSILSFVVKSTYKAAGLQAVLNLSPKVMWGEAAETFQELVRQVIIEGQGFANGNKLQTELALDGEGGEEKEAA